MARFRTGREEHWRRFAPGLGVALVVLWSSLAAASPGTGPFSDAEHEALRGGAVVTRPMKYERAGHDYAGGLAYRVVDAPPSEVWAALSKPVALYHVLPKTKRAEVIWQRPDWALVELDTGTSALTATFSSWLRWYPEDRMVRFWMDPKREADVADVYGFIRVDAFPGNRSLVSVGAAIDLGSGVLRFLFEEKIQRMVLNTPNLVARYVTKLREERAGAGRR